MLTSTAFRRCSNCGNPQVRHLRTSYYSSVGSSNSRMLLLPLMRM